MRSFDNSSINIQREPSKTNGVDPGEAMDQRVELTECVVMIGRCHPPLILINDLIISNLGDR